MHIPWATCLAAALVPLLQHFPCRRRLPRKPSQSPAGLGVAANSNDAVIPSHAHLGHIAGMVAGGRNNYPNAEVLIDRRDVAAFTDPGMLARAPEITHSSFAATEALVPLYPRLQQIDGNREISRGVSVFDLSGHSPLGRRPDDHPGLSALGL